MFTKITEKFGIPVYVQFIIAGVILVPICYFVFKFLINTCGFCKRGMSCCGADDEVEDNELVIEDDVDDHFKKSNNMA